MEAKVDLSRIHHPKGIARLTTMQDTYDIFASEETRQFYQSHADSNHEFWSKNPRTVPLEAKHGGCVHVVKGDWAEVTYQVSREYGKIFAVLNMANGDRPWMGDGQSNTQEENMACRTDLRYAMEVYDNLGPAPESRDYLPQMKQLVNGELKEAYLDVDHPRTCIKGGPQKDGSHGFLPFEKIFHFYELRVAADNLRKKHGFSANEIENRMRRKIRLQLETLKNKGIRHVVLGAFGCGAFGHESTKVADLYSQELLPMMDDFDVVTFAIYENDGKRNFKPFQEKLDPLRTGQIKFEQRIMDSEADGGAALPQEVAPANAQAINGFFQLILDHPYMSAFALLSIAIVITVLTSGAAAGLAGGFGAAITLNTLAATGVEAVAVGTGSTIFGMGLCTLGLFKLFDRTNPREDSPNLQFV